MRTSKLGMLYDVKQGVNRINDIANVLESDFEAYITFKETLPIKTTLCDIVVSYEEGVKITETLEARGLTVSWSEDLIDVTLLELS